MANELALSLSLRLTKGYLAHSETPEAITVDMTGSVVAGGSIASTTTAVAVPIGTLTSTTQNYAYFRNTAVTGTDNILLGTGTGGSFVPLIELKFKEYAMFRICSSIATTITFKSTAGTPVLQYWIAST